MTTFDAIAQIQREALSRTQALRFLVEQFGFTVIYAGEVIAAVFGDEPCGNSDTATASSSDCPHRA